MMLLLSVVVEAVEEVRMEDEKCCDSCQLLACARILLTLVGPPIRMCMPGSGGALEQWKKRSPRGIRLGTTRRDSTGITTDVEAVCERSMSMQEQESRVIRRFCLPRVAIVGCRLSAASMLDSSDTRVRRWERQDGVNELDAVCRRRGGQAQCFQSIETYIRLSLASLDHPSSPNTTSADTRGYIH
ncbi:hypothetical protein M433DRAFT_344740 [Acidomyces richmondensis BFW]|nr:hypothetical protein M433DRAFT_344740 [Acidomyces richmondensis BFW]